MSKRRLKPMDVVLYEGKLWVVSTAHFMDKQGRQLVSLAGWKRKGYVRSVPSYKCRIVYDECDREREEAMPGMCLYPNGG